MNANLSEAIDASIHAQLLCYRAMHFLDEKRFIHQIVGIKEAIFALQAVTKVFSDVLVDELLENAR